MRISYRSIAATVITAMAMPLSVFAQTNQPPAAPASPGSAPFGSYYLGQVGQQSSVTGLSQADPYAVVAKIINAALGLLGIILLGVILYAGFLWMTAGGDDKQVSTAKAWIKNAVIGLVLIGASFAISSFILGRLTLIIGG